MKVADLSPSELSHSLRNSGIQLSIGPFAVRIQSRLPSIADGINNLYADYSLAEEDEFTDFQVRLFTPNSIRRWFRPQVFFANDQYVPFKPLPLNQAFAFLEWGLNWCVSQYINTFLILHSAVVEKDGRAVILPAPPGSGKSTLCAALIANGWRLLSDEMALISLKDGMLSPIPRPVSLKNESIGIMQDFAPQCYISDPTHDTNKGTVAHMRPPRQSVEDAARRATPGWIIVPKYQANAAPELAELSKGQAFMTAVQNSFNYNLLGILGFESLYRLVDQCQCFEFTYSALSDAIDVFAQLDQQQ